MKIKRILGFVVLLVAFGLVIVTMHSMASFTHPSLSSSVALLLTATPPRGATDIVINEVAWMGTTTSYNDEWIELYNSGTYTVSLTDWTLNASDGTPTIPLNGSIPPGGHYLLERTDDDTVSSVPADVIYSGGLSNDGEDLVLRDGDGAIIDRVNAVEWFAGHTDALVPMVRIDPDADGSNADNWTHNPRCGTATNTDGISHTCTLTTTSVGAPLNYAVYFNERFTATETTIGHTTIEDALLAYIGNAETSIDMALYGVDRQSVVDALIAAHNRGVTVRVVGDDEAANDYYKDAYDTLESAGITVIVDTDLGKIQHNKFLVIDGEVIWTGSTNFTNTGLTLNANNSIVITDTMLASIYTAEFEEMWEGTFHEDKDDNTTHLLDYAGTRVESFFSPTDLVAFEVWEELIQADESIHFSMFFWTDDVLTEKTIDLIENGVEVYGVWDALGAASPYSADDALSETGADIRVEDFAGKVHHKFAVIDVEGDDPTVILGSYNWTDSGAYDNDENTLIIHDTALASTYYAEWQRMWAALGTPQFSAPVPVSPASGTVTETQTLTLTWQNGAGLKPESYEVKVDSYTFYTSTTTSLPVELSSTGVHTWMVRGYYAEYDAWSPWSKPYSVDVGHHVYLPLVIKE